MMYNDECIQSLIDGEWWITDDESGFSAGQLVWAYMPYVDMLPYVLISEGRAGGSTQHDLANYKVEQLRIGTNYTKTDQLPVAGMPVYNGEIRTLAKAKKRPAIILSSNGNELERSLTLGMPGWQKNATVIVAPYYGADHSGSRAGFPEAFVKKVYQGEYPQFMMDKLPLSGTDESVLYLSHMQAIGKHHNTIQKTNFRLSGNAFEIVHEWLNWFISGGVEEDSALAAYKEMNNNLYP